jgi:hypothetical protein
MTTPFPRGIHQLEKDAITKELLDWLDAGASQAMRFRELLSKM